MTIVFGVLLNRVFEERKSFNTKVLEEIVDFQGFADLGIPFDCVYIDFSKAFDKVSIPLLLHKCVIYKLGPRTISFIADYSKQAYSTSRYWGGDIISD